MFHCPAVTSARLLWLAVPVARVYIPYETHRPCQLTTRTMWAARQACAGDGVGQARARRGGSQGRRAGAHGRCWARGVFVFSESLNWRLTGDITANLWKG